MTAFAEDYARALLAAAESLDCVQAVADDLSSAREIFWLFARPMGSPQLSPNEKNALLRETLSDRMQPLSVAFLELLRRHFKHLPAAADRYRALADAALGRVTVTLRVPFPLRAELLEGLRTRFSELGLYPAANAEKAKFDLVTDKSLIGGFIARCNGLQIDASLRTALNRLKSSERFAAQ